MTATPPSSSRRQSRLVLALIGLVVLVAVGWAGTWVYAANRVEKEMDAWIEREAKEGRVWACADRALGGFPFRLELNCNTPSLTTTSGEKLLITSGSARATAQVWSPNAISAAFAAPARIENKVTGEVYTATWNTLNMSGVGDTSGRPQRFSVQANGLHLTQVQADGNAPLGSAEQLDFGTRLLPPAKAGPEDVEYNATISGLQSPVLAAFGEKGPVNLALAGVVTSAANLKPMPLNQRLKVWAAGQGEARLTQFSITSASVAVNARGIVSLDPLGQLNGNLTLGFAGFQQLAGQLGASGIIPAEIAPMVGALAMVGQPTDVDGRKGVSFPLTFKGGRMSLSGLPVGRVPAAF